MSLVFAEISTNRQDSWYEVPPWRHVAKGLEFVHYIRVKDSNINAQAIRLRAGIMHRYSPQSKYFAEHPAEDPNYKKTMDPIMGDTIVKFDLSNATFPNSAQ